MSTWEQPGMQWNTATAGALAAPVGVGSDASRGDQPTHTGPPTRAPDGARRALREPARIAAAACTQRLTAILLHEHANAIARIAGITGAFSAAGGAESLQQAIATIETSGLRAHDLARELGWLLGMTTPRFQQTTFAALLSGAAPLLARCGAVLSADEAALPPTTEHPAVDATAIQILLVWFALQRSAPRTECEDAAATTSDCTLLVRTSADASAQTLEIARVAHAAPCAGTAGIPAGGMTSVAPRSQFIADTPVPAGARRPGFVHDLESRAGTPAWLARLIRLNALEVTALPESGVRALGAATPDRLLVRMPLRPPL